jgi:hypothetical protein
MHASKSDASARSRWSSFHTGGKQQPDDKKFEINLKILSIAFYLVSDSTRLVRRSMLELLQFKSSFSNTSKMPQLNILTAICLWLAVTTGGCLLALPIDRACSIAVSMLFFNNLNILIAICELILGFRIMLIKKDFKKLKEQYKGREKDGALAFLFLPLPNVFDSAKWSKMWSTYSLYDPSYQNHESFGFFIDFGNGMSTIPPCLLWNYAMAYPERVSPVLVGCVGIASYWQVLYGTIIYLFSYCFNRRYVGRPMVEVLSFVGFSNSLWFFFPIIGIYASVCILRDGNFSVFRSKNMAFQ